LRQTCHRLNFLNIRANKGPLATAFMPGARSSTVLTKCDELLPGCAQLELWGGTGDIRDVSGPLPDEGVN
jgi:hypothetical protein